MKGLLKRDYTQNIDTLEHIAKIDPERPELIVEAHGPFYTNHCLTCRQAYSKESVLLSSVVIMLSISFIITSWKN